jgi:outer membrane protein OmpA-like peptidoglycan-associated protein
MPIFLQRATARPRLKMDSRSAPFEQEADRISASIDAPDHSPPASDVHPASTGTIQEPSLAGQILRHTLDRSGDSGVPIPTAARESMEQKFARDFTGVRIHANAKAAQLSRSIGANAFTTGNDIYFGDNNYNPDSHAGRSLLAHELTHIAQQSSSSAAPIQCDLTMSMTPTALGGFEMGLVLVQAPAAPGMFGTIEFHPDPAGPYSTEIMLIQTANLLDVAGTSTGTPRTPYQWGGGEAPRNDTRTPAGGSFIDALYANAAQSSATGPEYAQPAFIAGNPAQQHHGWLRSPTDVREASLRDYPSATFDSDFTFETVAKGSDNQVVYGAVNWGFQIRGGVAQNDYADAVDTESAEFEEALERFRGYYTHEPIVLYFDTDKDMPMAGEVTKLADVTSYMSRYPDVQIYTDGYADETGSANPARRADYNLNLSLRRADHVQTILAGIGVSESRIGLAVGHGETTTFAPGSPAAAAGSLRANRRVVITFVRNATSLINP